MWKERSTWLEKKKNRALKLLRSTAIGTLFIFWKTCHLLPKEKYGGQFTFFLFLYFHTFGFHFFRFFLSFHYFPSKSILLLSFQFFFVITSLLWQHIFPLWILHKRISVMWGFWKSETMMRFPVIFIENVSHWAHFLCKRSTSMIF